MTDRRHKLSLTRQAGVLGSVVAASLCASPDQRGDPAADALDRRVAHGIYLQGQPQGAGLAAVGHAGSRDLSGSTGKTIACYGAPEIMNTDSHTIDSSSRVV